MGTICVNRERFIYTDIMSDGQYLRVRGDKKDCREMQESRKEPQKP